MKLLRWLASLDRRIIYALVLIVTIIPLIWKSNPPIDISPEVQAAYNSIEKVPGGGIVMFSVDYDGSSDAELGPMLLAMLRHCFSRNIRVIMTAQWPLGMPLGQLALDSAAAEYHKVYGQDYVNIGYRPGQNALMVGIGKSGFRTYFLRDYRGTMIDSFPFMRTVRNYAQIDRLVALEAGSSGDLWVQYAGAQFGLRIILGVTGVMATSMYPYLDAKQIDGLVGGLRGAAEYETLIKQPYRGVWGMNSQSYVHVLIVVLVILGNITFYFERRAKKKGSGTRGRGSGEPQPQNLRTPEPQNPS
jgi:hypothetical protein